MRTKLFVVVVTIGISAVMGAVFNRATAQGGAPPALAGVVSSQEEGNMEGVLVNAREANANFTVTVVSNALGRFSFPADHLQPGKYTVTIRAVGYDLAAPASIDVVAGRPATLDVKLQKTKDLASQLTSMEWA